MDYHVFLLSRIREHYDETHDNTDSVAFGVRNTGRIITGAALIMVAVFGGFALGRMADLQQVGLGLAVAVLLDATIVRAVLVPASMRLLGDWNWYLPSWLEWLPHVGIEGPSTPPPAPPAESASSFVELSRPSPPRACEPVAPTEEATWRTSRSRIPARTCG